jgi:methionine-rich copper-binding protein CopC
MFALPSSIWLRRNQEMSNRTSIAVFALLAASLMASSASAHPTLKSANPPAEGTSVSQPTEIKLNFSEGVISKFSSVELKDQAGKKIATGKIATNPKDEKELVVALQAPLKAGTYTVTWNIVSVDTHRVHGTYSFKVGG